MCVQYVQMQLEPFIWLAHERLGGVPQSFGARLGNKAVHEDLQDIVDIKDQEHHPGIACA